MRRVAENGQFGHSHFQFDGNVPIGGVAVNVLPNVRKSPVDGHHVQDVRFQETLDVPDPQFQIGNHRILDHDGESGVLYSVGNLLHLNGVDGGTCAHPHHMDAVFGAELHMFGIQYLHANGNVVGVLNFLQPGQGGIARAGKAVRRTAHLPSSGSEVIQRNILFLCLFRKLRCRVQQLITTFRRAGSCYPNPFHLNRHFQILLQYP